MTADKRAATPTQAIELSVPEKESLLDDLKAREIYITKLLKSYVDNMKRELLLRIENYHFKNFPNTINNLREIIVEKEICLKDAIERFIEQKEIFLKIK